MQDTDLHELRQRARNLPQVADGICLRCRRDSLLQITTIEILHRDVRVIIANTEVVNLTMFG